MSSISSGGFKMLICCSVVCWFWVKLIRKNQTSEVLFICSVLSFHWTCTLVYSHSEHTDMVDTQFNSTVRLISATLSHSTSIACGPVLAMDRCFWQSGDQTLQAQGLPIYTDLYDLFSSDWLTSRKPINITSRWRKTGS